MYSNGTKLWDRAKEIIPGGNQLLSKRSERFLPGLWPAYYKKAKGYEVWGLDNKKYFDFAQMGVGSCILGYADEDVNNAVINAINNGNMSTLNSYEEVELAEKLINLNSWADMVRFSRTGGEACSIAVRIARAATGKDKVAICGYHGWHDWYLSANLGDNSNLDGQLLPGLDPKGVPRLLKGSILPFNYNKLKELEEIANTFGDELGTIIMEPVRSTEPDKEFLDGVREIANKLSAVLIFDEVTSGFRINVGGAHQVYGVIPDIVVFGKGLGNGYPISAIVGKREVMDHAQDSFISSTFWTERTGFVAALATLNKMEENNVPQYLIKYGKQINNGWKSIAEKNGIEIEIGGIQPLTHISFKNPDSLAIQTFYTQEMLNKGYLLGASVYTTFAYNDEIVKKFINDSDEVFGRMAIALNNGDIRNQLKFDIIQTGFKRLT